MNTLENFKKLGLSEYTLKVLKQKGFEEPTEIQKLCIPLIKNNNVDVVGQAQTGTGKTAAFGLPIIEEIDEVKLALKKKEEENKAQIIKEKGKKKPHPIFSLILTPTRELAIQVSEELNSLKGKRNIKITPIYGGQSIENQIRKITRGLDIIVGTPGRVLDLLKRKKLDFSNIKFLVLDEADEMLNMGFIEDIDEIIKFTPQDKRVLLFSATMPSKILSLAKKHMKNFEHIKIKSQQMTVDLTEQIYFEVNESDKFEALTRILDTEQDFYGIVFCRTKIDVDQISNRLSDRGYDAIGLHGDLSQMQREKIFKKFKNKKIKILVATDVAARGIDVNDLSHVINYSLPQDPESYVHRIGRTGRAGKEGTAITFVTPSEYSRLAFIKRITKTTITKKKLPEIDDIINSKISKIKNDILNAIENYNSLEKHNEKKINAINNISKDILQSENPEIVLNALLYNFYEDELAPEKYKEISEVSVDKKGKTRLFIAKGRNHGMTKKSLIKYITDKTSVPQNKIYDVALFDDFSFITTPFIEAEIILQIFKKESKGRRPIVVKAKERKKK